MFCEPSHSHSLLFVIPRHIISILDSTDACQQCFGSFERDMPRSTPSIIIASIIEGTSAPRIGRERDMTFENVLFQKESLDFIRTSTNSNCFIPRSDMKIAVI